MNRFSIVVFSLTLLALGAPLSHASSLRIGASYADVYTSWSEYNGTSYRLRYEEEWMMTGAFIEQRFSLGHQNEGLYVGWDAEIWPGLSYTSYRDDSGFAFGLRPGVSLGYEGSIESLHVAAALNGGLTWTLGTGSEENNEPYRELFSTSIASVSIQIAVEWKLRSAAFSALGLGYRIGLFGPAWTDNWIKNDPDNENWFDHSFRAYVRL